MSDNEQGTPSSKEQTNSGLSAEQVTELVNEVVNKAISARNKQVETKFTQSLADFSKTLDEKFAALAPKPVEETTEETQETKSKGAKKSEFKVQDTPEFKEMQKTLETLTKKLDLTEKEKQADAAKLRDKELRQKLSDELVKSGIDASRVRHAVGLLVDVEKRVKYNDDGEISFVDDENYEADLKSGLKDWVKTDDAKIYMPARGTTGTGKRPSFEKSNGTGNSAAEMEEQLANSLMDFIKS